MFVIFSNKQSFSPDDFGDGMFKKYLDVKWIHLEQRPSTHFYSLKITEVKSQDNTVIPKRKDYSFGSLIEKELVANPLPLKEFTNLFLLEIDKDMELIERKVYTVYDWANEVGGFYGFFELLINMVLPLC